MNVAHFVRPTGRHRGQVQLPTSDLGQPSELAHLLDATQRRSLQRRPILDVDAGDDESRDNATLGQDGHSRGGLPAIAANGMPQPELKMKRKLSERELAAGTFHGRDIVGMNRRCGETAPAVGVREALPSGIEVDGSSIRMSDPDRQRRFVGQLAPGAQRLAKLSGRTCGGTVFWLDVLGFHSTAQPHACMSGLFRSHCLGEIECSVLAHPR